MILVLAVCSDGGGLIRRSRLLVHGIEQVERNTDAMRHPVVASGANGRDFLDWTSIIGTRRAGRACGRAGVGHGR